MAIRIIATAPPTKPGGTAGHARRLFMRALILCAALIGGFGSTSAAAAAKVRLTGLTDLAFGTIADLTTDAALSENVCVYSNSATNGYHVTATGTGTGGAFTLASLTAKTGPNGIAHTLAFDVAWNSASGQSSGTLLSPNVPLTGQVSTAKQQTCNSGPATTASLIIILRAAALSSARADDYQGTVTLVVGPE